MTPSTSKFPVWAALLGSGLAGMLVALQSRANGALGGVLQNGYLAAAVSFGVGLVIVLCVLPFSRQGRRGLVRLRGELRSGHLPWWAITGGACGAFFVMSQGLAASVIGLALFTVGIVAGQVLGGLLLDRVGLGPGGRVNPTPQRVLGTVLAVIAVAVSAWSEIYGGQGAGGAKLWLMALPVVAGLLVAWQSAVNGLVRAAAQSALTSTLMNFIVGTALLGIAAAVSISVLGLPERWPTSPWYYIGGVVGPLFIAAAALLVRTAGVLLLSMSNVAGQLLASIVFEAARPLADGLTPWLLAGTGLALVAVVIASLPARRLAD